MSARVHAAIICPSNGAYLISFHGDLTQDATSSETHEAARSLRTAKRVAREGAASFGYVGPFRWTAEGRLWLLEASDPEDEIQQ